jgi:hypothetical protein
MSFRKSSLALSSIIYCVEKTIWKLLYQLYMILKLKEVGLDAQKLESLDGRGEESLVA